jgi:F0F1-type ATP synthase epsilon subunit
MNKINVVIVSRGKETYNDQAEIVLFRTFSGNLGIMYGHADLICAIKEDFIIVKNNNEEIKLNVNKAIASITRDTVKILSF